MRQARARHVAFNNFKYIGVAYAYYARIISHRNHSSISSSFKEATVSLDML